MASIDEIRKPYNETLYECVKMLTFVYPPKDHMAQMLIYLKKDMFVKNNSTAFQFLIYYLLQTLDQTIISKKIPTWPIFNVKDEYNFRKQVLEYVNELHQEFPEHVPKVLASHLISPGGFKFIRIMWKVSRFVLFRSVLRISNMDLSSILLPFIKDSRISSNLNNIINQQRPTLNNRFKPIIEHYTKEGNKLLNEISEVTKINEGLVEEIKELEGKNRSAHNKESESEVILENSKLKEIDKYCYKCKDLKLHKINIEGLYNFVCEKEEFEGLQKNSSSLTTICCLLESFQRLLKEKLFVYLESAPKPKCILIQTCHDLDNLLHQFEMRNKDIDVLDADVKKIFNYL